jgi:hypothetical protein
MKEVASKYTVLDFAEDVLKTADKPLLYQEIWELGAGTEYDKKLGLTGKTPHRTVGARLFVDIRDNPDSRFIKVGKNPARFFLKARANLLSESVLQKLKAEETKQLSAKKSEYSERQLHPLLAYFAYTNTDFNKGKAVYSKTIYHEKSNKTALNEWVHPDIIGFYIPIDDWNEHLLEFNAISQSKSITLYSFEIKKKIDKSNYRASFFQAVSNSSWANEGYLVTVDLKQDDDLYSELERLTSAFGIGLIVLDIEDIDSSKVVFVARTKTVLDWELMNKLCEQNPDFDQFIDDITKDFKVKTIHSSQYEKILDDPTSYIEKQLLRK